SRQRGTSMRNRILWLALALMMTLVLVERGQAQPPGRRGGPPRGEGRGGPGDGLRGFGGPGGPLALERALADLKLTDPKKEKAEAAVQAHQENVRKLMELARADLLWKMQEVLSAPELKQFQEALDRRPGPAPGGRGGAARGGLSVESIIERILSFDKNKDGKVTKDELPERMQDLIAKGDTNKDGALDREEIKKLAADQPRDDDAVARGRGPGGRGGPKGKGGPQGRGGPPGG